MRNNNKLQILRFVLFFRLYLIITAVLQISGCQKEQFKPFYIPPQNDTEIYFHYGAIDLTKTDKNPLMIDIQSGINEPVWPSVVFKEDRYCLLSHQPYYYKNERGIRSAYCDYDIEEGKRLSYYLDSIKKSADRTSYLAYESEIISIKTGILADSDISEQAIVSYDGSPDANLANSKGFRDSQSSYYYYWTRNPVPPSHTGITRCFAHSYFNFRSAENFFEWIYPVEGTPRFIRIRFSKPQAVSLFKEGSLNLGQAKSKTENNSVTGNPYISEISFGKYAGASGAIAELSTGSEDSRISFTVETSDGYRFSGSGFQFADSTILFSGNDSDTFRMSDHLILSTGGIQTEKFAPDYLAIGNSRKRSLECNKTDSICVASDICLKPDFCGTPGITGVRFSSKGMSGEECTVNDFILSEFNPYGIYEPSDTTIQIGGKFAEFQALRTCNAGHIIFSSGNASMDPGSSLIEKDQRVLFAASSEYFTNTFYSDSSYRSLSENNPVYVLNITTGKIKYFYIPLPASTVRIYGSGETFNPLIARVHSLIPNNSGSYTFHGFTSRGLRPDLESSHAMSPGFPEPVTSVYDSYLTEINPAGSRSNDGSSNPEDEFIEIRSMRPLYATKSPPSLEITVTNDVTSDARTYILPGPHAAGVLTLIRSQPVCFAGQDSFLYSKSLSLPNNPSSYTLINSFNNIEVIKLDPTLYAAMETGARRSLHQLLNGQEKPYEPPIWRISTRGGSECTAATFSEPGYMNAYDDFAIMTESIPDKIQFKYFSEDNSFPDSVTLYDEAGLPALSLATTIDQPNTVTASIPHLNNYRYLAFATKQSSESRGIYLRELYNVNRPLRVDTVSPTPLPGEVEYIRLCSPSGFDLSSFPNGIFIKDSLYEDKIIPWSYRYPASAVVFPTNIKPDGTTLQSNECMILLDPDYSGQALVTRPEDRIAWTVESGSAIGNSLASGESICAGTKSSSGEIIKIACYGAPDTPAPFEIPTQSGEYIMRIPDTEFDNADSYGVLP